MKFRRRENSGGGKTNKHMIYILTYVLSLNKNIQFTYFSQKKHTLIVFLYHKRATAILTNKI